MCVVFQRVLDVQAKCFHNGRNSGVGRNRGNWEEQGEHAGEGGTGGTGVQGGIWGKGRNRGSRGTGIRKRQEATRNMEVQGQGRKGAVSREEEKADRIMEGAEQMRNCNCFPR